jgi:hypothetical protein
MTIDLQIKTTLVQPTYLNARAERSRADLQLGLVGAATEACLIFVGEGHLARMASNSINNSLGIGDIGSLSHREFLPASGAILSRNL